MHHGNAEGLLGGNACSGDIEEPVAGKAVAVHLQGYAFRLDVFDFLTDSKGFLGVLRLFIGREDGFVRKSTGSLLT